MYGLIQVRVVLAVLLVCCLPQVLWAIEAGPVTLDDIQEMRRERLSAKKIMDLIERRGLGFAVDEAAEKRLRGFGFSPRLVAKLKGMRADVAAPEAGKEKGEAKPGIVVPKRDIDLVTEAEYRGLAERVKRTLAASGVTSKPFPTAHFNLIAPPKVGPGFQGDITKLEKLIAAHFQEPIASGVDPRFANIVLLENRYEFEKWIRALFKSFNDDGLTFTNPNALAQALASNGYHMPGLFSCCLQGMDEGSARHTVAFCVGYQTMWQLTNLKSPDALTCGFGSVTETMLLQHPGTTVISGYMDRALQGGAGSWADLARRQFADRKVGSVANAMVYSTQSMSLPQYAESWTLTSMLASDPKKFSELVIQFEKGTAPLEAVETIYGVKDAELLKRWQQYTARLR